jgi:hypothetical protein
MICLLLPYRSSILLSCILVSFAPVLHSVIHVLSDFSSKKAEWLQQVKGTTKKFDLDALVSSLREELGQLRVAQVRLISQHPTSCYLLPRLRFCRQFLFLHSLFIAMRGCPCSSYLYHLGTFDFVTMASHFSS